MQASRTARHSATSTEFADKRVDLPSMIVPEADLPMMPIPYKPEVLAKEASELYFMKPTGGDTHDGG